MEYEWDNTKRQANLEKHIVDFAAMECFEWDTAVVEPSNRHGEIRFLSIGYIGDLLHTVIYTIRGENIRIISLRKSNRREERQYART